MYSKQYIPGITTKITSWLEEFSIATTKAKQQSIVQEMFWPCYYNKIGIEEIDTLVNKIKTNPFEFSEGHLWNQLETYLSDAMLEEHKLIPFFKDISSITPIGLNTSPNACCGKYELLYRLLRPNSKQPKRGDILETEGIIELKGSEIKIQDNSIRGITYITNTNQIFSDAGFTGNTTTTEKWKKVKVYEIEKTRNKEHYEKEFNKNITKAKTCFEQYFSTNGWGLTRNELKIMFKNNTWNQEYFQRLTLKKIFQNYKTEKGFQKMIIFGDGTNLKILETEHDLDKLEIYSDYFRIGQTTPVGWYIK